MTPSPRHRRVRRLESSVGVSLTVALLLLYWAGSGLQPAEQLSDVLEAPGALPEALLGILALIFINMLFVASVTALDLLRPMHAKHFKESDPTRAERLQRLLDDRTRLVAACTFGTNAVRIGLVFCAFVIAPPFANLLTNWFGWSYGYGLILLAGLIAAIPIATVNIILGELVPKSYAALHPPLVAVRLGGFTRFFAYAFSGPAALVTWFAQLVTARFGGRATFTVAGQTEEEIKTLVESAQETGEIEVDEKELIHSVFEFSDTVAREVMTPRVDMDAMPVTADPKTIIDLIRTSGHSRIPLYEQTDDQIVGIVHAKDLLLAQLQSTTVDLEALMRRPLFVPENKNLHELLGEMRADRSQLAVVQDEFGGTAGIVSIEDIVEELVGDIVDEYDVEEPTIATCEGGVIVDGRADIDDVNHVLGSDFASEEFDTIGGFVFGQFGRQPKPHEEVTVNGYRFVVNATDGRRIQRLQITGPAPDPDET